MGLNFHSCLDYLGLSKDPFCEEQRKPDYLLSQYVHKKVILKLFGKKLMS